MAMVMAVVVLTAIRLIGEDLRRRRRCGRGGSDGGDDDGVG